MNSSISTQILVGSQVGGEEDSLGEEGYFVSIEGAWREGVKEMEAFNKALLAKQFWRLLKDDSSLVARLLKARYYPGYDIFDAGLGPRPSYSSCSILGAKSLVESGSRWLVGNGAKTGYMEW